MIAIKNRFSGVTLCEFDVKTIREAAEKGRADLYGANLRGANLRGANLGGADLGGKGKIVEGGFFTAGPLGSRDDYLQVFHTDKGIFVRAGCFFDELDAFLDAVIKTHGENSKHGKLYLGVANLIALKFSGK